MKKSIHNWINRFMAFAEAKEAQWEKADETAFSKADEKVFDFMVDIFGDGWNREHKTEIYAVGKMQNNEVA